MKYRTTFWSCWIKLFIVTIIVKLKHIQSKKCQNFWFYFKVVNTKTTHLSQNIGQKINYC